MSHHPQPHVFHVDEGFEQSVLKALSALLTQGSKIMATLADIQAKLKTLTDDVTAENTVIESAETLLTGLSQQITALAAQLAAAVANNDPAGLQAAADAADALATTVTAKTSELAAAVTANTPAAPAA